MEKNNHFEVSLIKYWGKLNDVLKEYNNSLYVFEFGHFNWIDKRKKFDLFSYAYGEIDRFYEILHPFFDKYGYTYTFDEISKTTYNLNHKEQVPVSPRYSEFNLEGYVGDVHIDIWLKYVNEIKFGGCSHTFYYRIQEMIDVGVYITLCNPIEGFNNTEPNKSSLSAKECLYRVNELISDFIILNSQSLVIKNYKDLEVKNALLRQQELEVKNALLRQQESERTHISHIMSSLFPNALAELRYQSKIIKSEELYAVERKLSIAEILFYIQLNQINALKELEETTIYGILEFIKNKSSANYTGTIINEIKEMRLPKIEEENKRKTAIFILLWNLWHNAEKHSGTGNGDDYGNFNVTLNENDCCVCICFENESKNGNTDFYKQVQLYIQNKTDINPNPQKGDKSGASSIRAKLIELGWEISFEISDPFSVQKIGNVNQIKTYEFYKHKVSLITNIPLL